MLWPVLVFSKNIICNFFNIWHFSNLRIFIFSKIPSAKSLSYLKTILLLNFFCRYSNTFKNKQRLNSKFPKIYRRRHSEIIVVGCIPSHNHFQSFRTGNLKKNVVTRFRKIVFLKILNYLASLYFENC